MIHVKVNDLDIASNVCEQELREVWKNDNISVAHVIMEPKAVSLLHKHDNFTEIYYIISGQGEMDVNRQRVTILDNELVEIESGESHRLKNTGDNKLIHLVISNPPFNSEDVNILEKN